MGPPKKRTQTPTLYGDYPYALSVSESKVQLGQDRLSGVCVSLWFGCQTIGMGCILLWYQVGVNTYFML